MILCFVNYESSSTIIHAIMAILIFVCFFQPRPPLSFQRLLILDWDEPVEDVLTENLGAIIPLSDVVLVKLHISI